MGIMHGSEDSQSEIDLHVMELCKAFTLSRAGVLVVDVVGLEKVTNDQKKSVST